MKHAHKGLLSCFLKVGNCLLLVMRHYINFKIGIEGFAVCWEVGTN